MRRPQDELNLKMFFTTINFFQKAIYSILNLVHYIESRSYLVLYFKIRFIHRNCFFRIMSTPFKGGPHIVLLRLASASVSVSGSALASAPGLTLRHPLLNFFLGAPKYDPSYVEIIFHW